MSDGPADRESVNRMIDQAAQNRDNAETDEDRQYYIGEIAVFLAMLGFGVVVVQG